MCSLRRLESAALLAVLPLGFFAQAQAQDVFSTESGGETCQQWLDYQKAVRGATTLLTIEQYQRAIAPGRNPPWINCVNACADAVHKDPKRLWCAQASTANRAPTPITKGDEFNTNTDAPVASQQSPAAGQAAGFASGPLSITDPNFYRRNRLAPAASNSGGRRRFAPAAPARLSGAVSATGAGATAMPSAPAPNAGQTYISTGSAGTTAGGAAQTSASGAATGSAPETASNASQQPSAPQPGATVGGSNQAAQDEGGNVASQVPTARAPFELQAEKDVWNAPPQPPTASYPAPKRLPILQAGAQQYQPPNDAPSFRYAFFAWPLPNGGNQPLCFRWNSAGALGRTEIELASRNGQPARYTRARVTVTPDALIVNQLYSVDGRWVSAHNRHLKLSSGMPQNCQGFWP